MPFVRLTVTALAFLLLAAPSFAQDFNWAHPPYLDWADWSELPVDGIVDHYTKATIEAEPCCAPASVQPRSEEPTAPREAALLKQLEGGVSRDGMVLRLALDGGRTFRITDCVDDSICIQPAHRKHRLVGWWPTHRSYLVEVTGYGLYEILVISGKNGRTISVPNVPVPSPSGRHAVALMSSPVLNVRLDILDLTTNPPKRVSVARLTCDGVRLDILLRPNPVWIDETHVRFEGDAPWPDYQADALYTGKQVLRIGPGRPQWEC